MANTTADKLALAAANKVAIKAAIVAKNPATAPTDVMSQWPTAIASIPSGGDYDVPDSWPDIRDILKADTDDEYPNKMIILYSDTAGGIMLVGAKKYRTSDGVVLTDSTTDYHWSDRTVMYHWAIFYSDADFDSALTYYDGAPAYTIKWIYGNDTARFSGALTYCWSLRFLDILCSVSSFNLQRTCNLVFFRGWSDDYTGNSLSNTFSCAGSCGVVKIPHIDASRITDLGDFCYSNKSIVDISGLENCGNITSAYQSFDSCTSLVEVGENISFPKLSYHRLMFRNCRSLVSISDNYSFASATDVREWVAGCESLRKVPDVIFLGKVGVGYAEDMFRYCYSLMNLPTHVTTNVSLSFSDSAFVKRYSVATFDAGGSIVGGFVGNLKSWDVVANDYLDACPNEGQVITLNAEIRTLFSASEQSAIETFLASKNWTLAW